MQSRGPWLFAAPDMKRLCHFRILVGLNALWLIALCVAAAPPSGAAQHHELNSIHTIQVASFGDTEAARAVRQHVIDRLHDHIQGVGLKVVPAGAPADAILRGDATIWATGSVSVEPHSHSYHQTNYNGYLSIELDDPQGEPLWSWLVTPSRFRSGPITRDLADHAATQLLAAVAAGETSPATDANARPGATPALRGAGATLPAPLYRRWFESSGFPVRYDAIGSEAGIEQLTSGSVDFAASDMPPLPQNPAHLLRFPTVVGGVVPIYNLPGLGRTLRLTPEILAGIYSGTIRNWNDPRIREANRGARLPSAPISVIHRSDGSGTTFVWTGYLSRVSPAWKTSVGSGARVEWPTGTGAAGSDGVADLVQKTPDSIGYVELIYAIQHQLAYAQVRNAAGQFILADLSSIAAAASEAAPSGGNDMRYSILNAAGKSAYPISTFTWILVPADAPGSPARATLAKLLAWALTSGQKQCASLGYVPLPREVADRALHQLDALK
jgi:phosphate ABC transporter phosphate-binding protein